MGRTRHAACVVLASTAVWGSLARANNRIELVSLIATTAGEWSSERGRQSADGRYVFFRTAAALTADDLNGRIDICRRDLNNPGRSSNLVRVGRGSGGTDLGSDAGEYSISADGEPVAFVTSAAAISAGKATATAIALRNRQTGTTVRGSPLGTGASKTPALSRDGQVVAYRSLAGNLAAGDSNAGVADVRVNGPLDPDRVFRAGFE